MQIIVDKIRHRAKAAAKSAAFTAFGVLFCLVGVGFATAALWQWVSLEYGALQASLIVGGLYFVAGLILMLISPGDSSTEATRRVAASRDTSGHNARDRDAEPFFQMAQGFAEGMQAGRAARQGRG